ncbi:hypothetical protein FHW36_104311 [Chitinophaga polysaccharea]|uniref:YD repeat-containing protein n=1 Tax=Chitinophaga polysaccharea TaxID=1293035 RepID=A0A561PR93_9BACT|nr:hypothetical protein [Chitinophaga polysaccharea]TWF40628.1 hypothetical protein FHW36_104311 [Chitinophaga polysaccharea]
MAKISFTQLFIYIAIINFVNTGCRKEPGIHFPGPHCDILSITGNFNGPIDTVSFSYNIAGNPITVTRAFPSTGFPNYQFRYDKNNRLTDYITLYPNSNEFETWHRYYYRGNRIVFDSIFQFGLLGEVPRPSPFAPNQFIRGYAAFEYDEMGRITKTIDSIGWIYGRLTRYYTYNQEGNLVKVVYQSATFPEEDSLIISGYDNKVNMHLTHPVWQFLDRMYSLNNPIKGESYNKHGLPLAFGISAPVKNGRVLDPGASLADFIELGTYSFINIRYSCN